MSYVIQNFYDYSKKFAMTPKFKIFFFNDNIANFFLFIKLSTFLNLNKKSNILNLNYFNSFFKYFFNKAYIKFLYKINVNLFGNYTNSFSQSLIHNIFYQTLKVFNKFYVNLNKFVFSLFSLNNLYFLSIKSANISLKSNLYKNFFFFFFFINSFLWFQHSPLFKPYLSFIFINYNAQISRFYNTHFFKIYNM